MSDVLPEMLPWVTGWQVSDRREAAREAAALLRRIGSLLLSDGLDPDAVRALRRCLQHIEETAGPPEPTPPFRGELHPWVGPSNYLAPPMTLAMEGPALVGTVRLPPVYGGGAPWVHGGVIAGLFDAMVATRASLPGAAMTARLVINYRRPVPFDTELRFEASIDRTEGRKRFTSSRLFAGTTLCADAEAVMIARDVELAD
jgi:hypothetical protein